MILDHINDIASICVGHGVKTAIISPGSRSAPLTLAFSRHPKIDSKVISDERSAAFIALGIAQQQNTPVVLICTSGSAALNYAPAIAEAYYQEIPLLVLTADRPPEWIGQYDGQTIRQNEVYGNHVKSSFTFPSEVVNKDVNWHCNRIINDAILEATEQPMGPVHVNIPLREPFYPTKEESTAFREVRIIKKSETERTLTANVFKTLEEEWSSSENKVIVVGQSPKSETLKTSFEQFAKETATPIVADIISNQHGASNIKHQDLFLNPKLDKMNTGLRPDLLITFGGALISKNLKTFLRNNQPKTHWHISLSSRLNDSLQNVTRLINIKPEQFFNEFKPRPNNGTYKQKWDERNGNAENVITEYLKECEFGELKATKLCMDSLPENSQLHLANSMAVRYANILGVSEKKNITIHANRGTSGIDGSNSTAVGAALAQDKMVTLITGDMAFFYDRNAFWHNYDLGNLRIIILNNHAGGIFRMIEGPASQPELEEYFETYQKLNAKNTAVDFNFEYCLVNNEQDLYKALNTFFDKSNNAKILEVESSSQLNTSIFIKLKQKITSQL